MHTFTAPSPSALSGPLRTIAQVVNKSNPVEVLRGALVQVSPQGCILTGTDIDQIMQINIPEIQSEYGSEIAFIMLPHTVDMIHRLPDAPVKFSLALEDQVLYIECGQSSQKHSTMPETDFPPVRPVEGQELPLPGIDWDRVAFAVDPNEPRAQFTGVYLDFGAGKLVGTDSIKMAILDLDGDMGGDSNGNSNSNGNSDGGRGSDRGVIIPLKAVNLISKISKSVGKLNNNSKGDALNPTPNTTPAPTLTISQDRLKIKVVAGNIALYSNLISSRYPDYNVITSHYPGDVPSVAVKVKVNVADLEESVARAGAMGKNDSLLFRFRLNENNPGPGPGCQGCETVEVIGQSEGGAVTEVVKIDVVKYDPDGDFNVRFNWRYLLETLKAAGTDAVFWSFHGERAPSVVRGVIGDGQGDGKDSKWLGFLTPRRA